MPTTLPSIPEDLDQRLARPVGRRAAILATHLLASPFIAWFIASLLGMVGFARGMTAAAFPLVLAVGYQLWWLKILGAAIGTLAPRLGGWWQRFRRQSTAGAGGLRPTADDVRRFAVRTFDATHVFRSVGNAAALIALLGLGLGGGWWAAVITAALLVGWGRWLASLGYRGWLPIPEGE